MANIINKIMWNNKEEEVTQGEINWGELKEIRQNSIVLKEHNRSVHQFRDTDKFNLLLTLKSIKKAPFDISELNLRKLSLTDGAKLEKTAFDLNKLENVV